MKNEATQIDVKCLSFGRVGTVAVSKALRSHPGVAMSSWKDDHDKIINNDLLIPRQENRLSGFTVHHQFFLDKQNRQHLDKVTALPAGKLLHLVRDPMNHIVGWYNHIVESASFGLNNWSVPGSFDDFLSAEEMILATLKNEMIAQLFYPAFQEEDIMLVEFNQLDKHNFSQTISNIQDFWGIDRHPVDFTQPLNDLTTKLLYRGMTVNLNGDSVKLAMLQESFVSGKPGTAYLACLDGLGEQMSRYAPSVRPVEGKIYIGLSRENQELKKSTLDILRRHQAEIFGPAIDGWIKNAEVMANKVKERKISALTGRQQSRLWQLVGEDMKCFVQRYPGLQDQWQLL